MVAVASVGVRLLRVVVVTGMGCTVVASGLVEGVVMVAVQVGPVCSVDFGVVRVVLAAAAAPVPGFAVVVGVEAVVAATSCRPTAAVTVAFLPPSRPVDASNLLCLHHTVVVGLEVPAGSHLDLLQAVPVSPASAPRIDRDHRSS